MNQFDDLDEDDVDADHLQEMLRICIEIILRNQDAQAFMTWARTALPFWLDKAAPIGLPEDSLGQLAMMWAREIWNHTPLPDNHFKPQPLPQPERNAPCVCGSGKKYKHCCLSLPALPPLPVELLGGLMLNALGKKAVQQYAKAGAMPANLLPEYITDLAERENYKEVAATLRPYIENHNHLLHGHIGAYLFDMYCDACTHTHRTKRAKLTAIEHLKQHKDKVIRASVWQRLATIEMDDGNTDKAWQAFQQAQRTDPDDPALAFLEITLLGDMNQWQQAKRRAQFWFRRLSNTRYGKQNEMALDLLQRCAEDPQKALQKVVTEKQAPELGRVLAWLRNAPPLEIDQYEKSSMPIMKEHARNKTTTACVITPRKELQQLEQKWHQCFLLEKPFSISYYPFDDAMIWEDDRWVDFLEKHPQALNSAYILDDVLTAVMLHPDSGSYLVFEPFVDMIAQRIRLMLQKLLPADTQIPWIAQENRPWLRILVHAGFDAKANNKQARMMDFFEYVFALNPNDNHGLREILIETFLKEDRNQEALRVAQCYPDDMMAQVVYGEVLAYLREQQYAQAEQSFVQAWERLPKVARALLNNKMRKPSLQADRESIGGDDKAWHYREAMHGEWQRTQGALEWLKQQVKKAS